MKKPKVPISERTFIRSLTATKGEETISAVAQPYLSGMYVAYGYNASNTVPHKQYDKWIRGVITEFEKDGYAIETSESLYISFLEEDVIVEYELLK